MDSYSIEIPQTIDESDSDDSGPVYDPDASENDRDVEKEAMNAIDNYFRVWQDQLKSQEKRDVSSRLVSEDKFLAHNIDFLKRRERFKTMFAQLKIDNARVEETSSLMQDLADESEAPLVHNLEDLATFDEGECKKHFESMDLLRDMVEATREAFQKFVLPQLAGGMKDGSTAKMAECACEAALIVGAFSERVVAPRCSAFARALKEYLVTAASLTYNVKDEDLPQVIADLAAPSLDPDVLRRHAKKFYSEVDLFCTHVGEAYPKRRRRSTRRKRRSTRRRSSLLAPVGAPAPAAAPAAAQRAKTPEANATKAL